MRLSAIGECASHYVVGRTLVWQTLLTHYMAGRRSVWQTLLTRYVVVGRTLVRNTFLTHHVVGGTSEWQDRKSSDLMMPHFLADHCFRCGYCEHVSCNQYVTAFKMIHNAFWPLNHVQEYMAIFTWKGLQRYKTYCTIQSIKSLIIVPYPQ